MDGDMSHSSGIKLLTVWRDSRLFSAFLFPSLSFHLAVMFTPVLYSVFIGYIDHKPGYMHEMHNAIIVYTELYLGTSIYANYNA
jgi:hypothetical protein